MAVSNLFMFMHLLKESFSTNNYSNETLEAIIRACNDSTILTDAIAPILRDEIIKKYGKEKRRESENERREIDKILFILKLFHGFTDIAESVIPLVSDALGRLIESIAYQRNTKELPLDEYEQEVIAHTLTTYPDINQAFIDARVNRTEEENDGFERVGYGDERINKCISKLLKFINDHFEKIRKIISGTEKNKKVITKIFSEYNDLFNEMHKEARKICDSQIEANFFIDQCITKLRNTMETIDTILRLMVEEDALYHGMRPPLQILQAMQLELADKAKFYDLDLMAPPMASKENNGILPSNFFGRQPKPKKYFIEDFVTAFENILKLFKPLRNDEGEVLDNDFNANLRTPFNVNLQAIVKEYKFYYQQAQLNEDNLNIFRKNCIKAASSPAEKECANGLVGIKWTELNADTGQIDTNKASIRIINLVNFYQENNSNQFRPGGR